MSPNRLQAIIKTNDDPVPRPTYDCRWFSFNNFIAFKDRDTGGPFCTQQAINWLSHVSYKVGTWENWHFNNKLATNNQEDWPFDQGWGRLRQFPPYRYFSNFSKSPKYILASEYHVHIWQVSPQLSCSDTWQIWKWCKALCQLCHETGHRLERGLQAARNPKTG